MVEAIGRQLDRCDVCGKKVHKVDLVRTQVAFLAPAGSNYLTYSSYNASGWTADTMSASTSTSIGVYADRSRVRTTDDNTSTGILGPTTWDGAGTLRSSSAIVASSWTSLVFAADVGPYERETDPSMTFLAGLCDSAGANKSQQLSVTTKGATRLWFTVDIADVPATLAAATLYFYITTSSTNEWWADRLQVIKDATCLQGQAFIPTFGASVDRVDTASMTMKKVCGSCREPLLSKTNSRNRRPEKRSEEPVTTVIQEI